MIILIIKIIKIWLLPDQLPLMIVEIGIILNDTF